MKDGDCSVQVVYLQQGINQGCKVCRKVLISGNYLVRLIVQDDGQTHSYLLGMQPFEHCGETKYMFQCFKTEEGALAAVDQVNKHLDETGSTEGLSLCAMTPDQLVKTLCAMESH